MKKLYATLHHNFIFFAKSPAAIIIAILPLVILILLGSIYPVVWVLPQVITLSIIIISFTSVGIQYHEYRNTKFFRVARNTDVSVFLIVVGTFITIVMISMFLSLTLIVITWFFTNAVPILNQTIDNIQIEPLSSYSQYISNVAMFTTFSLGSINWLLFSYSLILTIVMTSLLAVLIGSVFKSVNNYTIFSMIYIFIYIIFGGIIIPWYITNSSKGLLIIQNMIPNTHTASLIGSSINHSMQLEAMKYGAYCNEIIDALNSNNVNQSLINISINNDPSIKDPLNLSIVYSVAPWLKPFIDNVTAFINQFSKNDFNSGSAFYLLILSDITYLLGSHDEFINKSINVFSILGETINQMNPGYAFAKGTSFAIKTNLLPYLFILISLPNFIIMGRSE